MSEATHATEPHDASGYAGGDHTMQCMEVWGGNHGVDTAVEMPGLNAWVVSRPYEGESTGGDVHYVSSCASGRITRLLVADVSGHGAVVSELAVKLRDLMRRYVNHVDQSKFVSLLNKEFIGQAKLGRFATAIVATYWAPTDYLVASNAGHPRPLFYRAATKTWTVLKDKPRLGEEGAGSSISGGMTNLPLGIDEVASYDQFSVKLEIGDVVLIYTDALVEAMDSGKRLLGEDGLLAMVRALDASKPRELITRLIDRVVGFAGGKLPNDDMTVLALSASGKKPTPTLAARLGALKRFVVILAGSWRNDAPPVPWPEFSVPNLLGPIVPAANRLWGGKSAKR